MSDRVVWQPQPKQMSFMARPEYEALYGGAAGGGKSDALLVEALRQVHIPAYRGIIFRKTFPMMSELIDRSLAIYKPSFPGARYNASAHVWQFPSGAKIYFGNMQHVQDRTNYQGRRFDFIGFDELTHFTWDEYSYMFSRNRPSREPGGERTRVYIRATANPGGIGHGWVKSRFIDPAPPLTTINEDMTVQGPDGPVTISRDRVFVPATVFDNQALLDADPAYLGSLAMLPQAERDALLYGNWDSFSGQVFREWKNDPSHYADRLWTHVIDPFDPPKHWKCWRGFDYGYTRPFSVGWFVADEEGRLYHIAEWYGCTGTPNEGIRMNPVEIAEEINRIEAEHPLLKGRDITGIADPAIFEKSHGESIADLMARHPNYVSWYKGDHTRLTGKMQIHYRLAFDDNGIPMFQVFNTCRNFIRTMPALVYDEKKVEDIDTTQEDHIYDMTRYVLMESPISPRQNMAEPAPWSDPLNQFADRKVKRFGAIHFDR